MNTAPISTGTGTPTRQSASMTSGEERKSAERRGLFGRFLVAGAAAFGLWAFVVNREVINWVDSEWKRLTIVVLAFFFAAVAVVPLWRQWRGPWTRAALLVVLAFSLGETRRAWLRYQYASELAGGASIDLLHPVTTLDLAVRHFESRLPGLVLPRLRVLQVTDLHITEELPRDYYQRVQTTIAAENPDIILLTGDYLSQSRRLPLLEAWLSGLPRARYGSFAVLGNHDHWVDRDHRLAGVFTQAGITVLSGRCTLVPVPGASGVRLCGTESPWGPALDRNAIDQGAPGDSPLFVMSHTPDNVYALHELGAAAVFAGHTHGGQVRLPVVGAIIVPSIYGRRFDVGRFNVEGTELYVSAGIGADQPPLRIYCPPELVEVDFHR
jgi:predicted MPP superfamily phosphohydrolase